MLRKTCIEDYILLTNGCLGGTSVSKMYLDQLEGISVENLANVEPEKYANTAQFVRDKLYLVANSIELKLKALLTARGLELNTNGAIQNACKVGTTTWGAVALDKGILVSKQWIGSESAAIWVDGVKVKSPSGGATTVKVKDLEGNVLYSKDITLIADFEVNISIKQHFRYDNILITVDSTNVSLYEYVCTGKNDCAPCMKSSKYLSIKGWNGAGASDVGFVGACVRLDCTDIDILCQYLNREGVAMAILYELGGEVLNEWISPNNRVNIIKTHGAEWASTKIKEWPAKAIDFLNWEIDAIVQQMKKDTYCYNCKGRIVGKAMLP